MPVLNNPMLDSIIGGNLQSYGTYAPRPSAKVNQTGAFNAAIPGFNGLTSGASDIISNLLKGLPSADPAKRAGAFFGAASGMPGSDFVRNRSFDLYGEQAEERKQRGINDLMSLIQNYSGTIVPTAGQQIQQNQADRDSEYRMGRAAIDDARAFQRDQPVKKEYSYSTRSPGQIGEPTYKYRYFM